MRIAGLIVLAACAAPGQPLRFTSPMLGTADVPPEPLSERPAVRRPSLGRPVTGQQSRTPDVELAPIRVASAAAADAVAQPRGVVLSLLPAPHRLPAGAPRAELHHVLDLRGLVGRRESGDPLAVALGWAHELGEQVAAGSGPALVEWAGSEGRLAAPTSAIEPGDLLVFDRTEGDRAGDLVALALARDPRGVIEFVYVAGGVIRRGFADPQRPSQRRDANGVVANTFMRAGKLWPPKGTHYLAGELLAHVVRAR
jgi:hypothetical protein